MAGLIDKVSRSWRLIKASAAVLRADKELLVLPVLSGLATLLVCGALVWQASATGTFDALKDGQSGLALQSFYVWLFLFYLVQYFIIIFFNTALVGAAIERLNGGNPTLNSALSLALRRIGPIFGYALISATVGLLLRFISERLGFIGRLVAAGVGLACTVATFLVVPVLAAEGVGPIEAFKKSVLLLKKTWGENLIGNAGITLALSFVGVPFIFAIFGGIFLSQHGDAAFGIPLVVLAFAALMAMAVVSAALTGIYAAAVYHYAVRGEPPAGFDRDLIQNSFSHKA